MNIIDSGFKAIISLSELLKNLDDNYMIYSFENNKILSSYLYAILAGPYKILYPQTAYKSVPMVIYCRESLFDFVENKIANYVFNTTD